MPYSFRTEIGARKCKTLATVRTHKWLSFLPALFVRAKHVNSSCSEILRGGKVREYFSNVEIV